MATAVPAEVLSDALALLDPSNDAHWTKDGLPAVGAVNANLAELGLPGVSLVRSDLTAFAPGFTREDPVLPVPDEEPVAEADERSGGGETPPSGFAGAGDAAPPAPASLAHEAPGAALPVSAPAAPVPAPVITGCSADEAVAVRAQIADLQKARSVLVAEIEAKHRTLAEVDAGLADLDLVLRRVAPPPKPAEEIQRVLRQQQAHRANAIEAAQIVASAVAGVGVDAVEVLNRGRALADSIRLRGR